MEDPHKLQEVQKEFENRVAFNALNDSTANYISLLLQYLLMAVILIVKTKFHSRKRTYITYRGFSTTLTKLTNYLLTLLPLLGLSSNRVIPTIGILIIISALYTTIYM